MLNHLKKGEINLKPLTQELEQVYIEKVKENGFFLKQIPHQTEAICLAAVEKNGLKFKIFLDCTVKGGSLYLYDEYWLKQLLIENTAALIKAEAFVIVGKTFNDPRFR